jgi:hypothetical protein
MGWLVPDNLLSRPVRRALPSPRPETRSGTSSISNQAKRHRPGAGRQDPENRVGTPARPRSSLASGQIGGVESASFDERSRVPARRRRKRERGANPLRSRHCDGRCRTARRHSRAARGEGADPALEPSVRRPARERRDQGALRRRGPGCRRLFPLPGRAAGSASLPFATACPAHRGAARTPRPNGKLAPCGAPTRHLPFAAA